MRPFRAWMIGVASVCLMATPALAISGADALKRLNLDNDQTIELPEAFNAAVRHFSELNKDNDLTLERAETKGVVTEAEWKRFNKDNDPTLEMDEWLRIVRARFVAADANKDGKLTAHELDSPAGQSFLKLLFSQ